MPIYDYACEKCESEFEVEQRITEDPLKTCPKCRSRKVKRLISQTSFVLKGGGWYSDLYSSSKGKPEKSESEDSSSKSEDSKSEGSKSEDSKSESSKSDKKTEKKSDGKKSKKGKAAAA